MRKRLLIAGHSREGLELVPLLEANPAVEICALVTDDPAAAAAALARVDPTAARRLEGRITGDVETALATHRPSAVIDAEAPARLRERLLATRGVQVTTPGLARLLFAFGPADAFHKPDLLQALREILDSADLTRDRRSVLDLVLQVAVTATGADRGSLMLWDARERALRVEVALGIEDELIAKIRVAPGEAIAGRAFAAERAILVHGKADRSRWQIVRERDDVESAISAPLAHGGRVIGVLNLSHARNQNQFNEADLDFVEQLARLDARIIARAEEYHGLLRESQALRIEAQVRRILARAEPLAGRLAAVCALLAEPLRGGVGQLWLREAESDVLLLQAASTRLDPLALRERLRFGEGVPGRAAESRRAVWLAGQGPDADLCYAALPVGSDDALLGVIALHGARDPSAGDLAERLAAASGALAEELAAALRAARLERESRRAERLGEAIAAMGAARDARELADEVTRSGLSLLDAQDAVLRLVDESSGRYRIASWSGIGQWRKAALAELERKLATEAMRSRRLLRVADLASDPAWSGYAVGIRSAMIAPLLRDGRPIGSLSVLGQVPDDPLLGERFGPADAVLLERFVQHVQASLAGLRPPEPALVDAVTGLPGRAPLRERLVAEIARSRVRGHRLALLAVRVAELPELDRVATALASALRGGLREFDVLARPERDLFLALVPEPEGDTSLLLTTLYRRAREAADAALAGVDLRIGYAVYPDDGEDADALLARASEARVEAL
ncbi:MAG TPA: GAF domain-containing protein [Myxococcota bacterium]|nr:GAF domain-containing protein [Myxococcota bacterium]